MCQVPEGRGTFIELSVAENLEVGAWRRKDKAGDQGRQGSGCYELFPILAQRRDQRAGELSGGEQQMLGVARALMGKPRLLLLDEPSLGLAPLDRQAALRDARPTWCAELGVTTMVVEQNAQLALQLADRAYLLEVGEIVREGSAAELQADDQIKRAYLGV